MEETIKVIIVAIVCMAFMVGLAALILWIKDRATWTGTIVKRTLGLLSLLIGLIIAVWIIYNLFHPTEHFRWGPTLFLLMIWLGVEWLFGSDTGFEDERIKRIVGALSLFIGLTIAGWIVYNLFHPTEHFQWISIVVCLSLIWFGANWLFGPGPGLEDEHIDFDSPELQAARHQARETLPNFIQQVPHGVDQAYIKLPFETDQGVTEHIWGYVDQYSNGRFTVSLANTPYTQEGEYNTWQYVSESEVEDWQIMLPNGKIKGGYSTIGAFRYLENRGRRLSKKMQKHKSQLVDA